MQTPLIFKLFLLLAVALRLIKSEKKAPVKPALNYFLLNYENNSKITPISPALREEVMPEALIKCSYREQIRVQGRNEISVAELRELPLAEQLICTAYQVNKFYKKGGLFRFLWHGNNWLIAFGQSLDFVNKDWANTYRKLIAEIAFLDDDTFQYTNVDWEEVYPFPEGTKSYDSLTLFENTFDLNQYLRAISSLTIKAAYRTGL